MSEPKKLNLTIEEIGTIAKSLNQNILANKTRAKEDRIPTDHYIRKIFNISRKDFNYTAKNYGIQYSSTSGLYQIPEVVNQTNTKVNTSKVSHGSNKVIQVQALKTEEVNNDNTGSIPIKNKGIEQSLTISLYEISEQFNNIANNEIFSLTNDIKEMLQWYKSSKDKKITADTEINLNNDKLNGEVVTRSYKVYKTVSEEFSLFAANRKESIKDLISLALVEFIEKYKK